MKTVGDLKRLIKESGGVLNFGAIRVTYVTPGVDETDNDVDVKHGHDLICWIGAEVSPDTLLEETGTFTNYVNFEEKMKGSSEKDEIISDLQKEVKILKNNQDENQLAVGKVEAYEKILLGRELTIGK